MLKSIPWHCGNVGIKGNKSGSTLQKRISFDKGAVYEFEYYEKRIWRLDECIIIMELE